MYTLAHMIQAHVAFKLSHSVVVIGRRTWGLCNDRAMSPRDVELKGSACMSQTRVDQAPFPRPTSAYPLTRI
jgi:hypothetical protein